MKAMTATPRDTKFVNRELKSAIEVLSALYRAALRSVERQLRAGRTATAARLARHARFLRNLIRALQAELSDRPARSA